MEETTTSSLGQKIRRIRQMQGQTLEEVANASGFSKSLLSKIENGRIVPPVATLVKIARTLGLHVSQLLEAQPFGLGAAYTSWEDARNSLSQTEKGYSIAPLATHYSDKILDPFLFHVREGEVKEHSVTHEGEELIFVVKGSIRFVVGSTQYTLSEGDSLYFNARQSHHVAANGDEAYYLDVFVNRESD